MKENSKMVDFQRRVGRFIMREVASFGCECLVDRLTNECDALKKQIQELSALLDEPFQGPEDELKLLISNFQRDQDKKKRELQDVRILVRRAAAKDSRSQHCFDSIVRTAQARLCATN